DDLATVVEASSSTTATCKTDGSPEGPEVVQCAVLPEERVVRWNAGQGIWSRSRIGVACYLALLVNETREDAIASAQRTQVPHLPVLPEKPPNLGCSKKAEAVRDGVL